MPMPFRSIAVLVVLFGLSVGTAAAHEPLPDHREGEVFRNPNRVSGYGALSYLWNRFMSRGTGARWDRAPDGDTTPVVAGVLHTRVDDPPVITWLGQSTVLLQAAGVNVITDPMLAEYAGPIRISATRRYAGPEVAIAELPPIDLVVLSHDHYDHLDIGTLAALPGDPSVVAPLRVGELLKGVLPDSSVTELDWWESVAFNVGDARVEVRALPSQHTSGRSLFDRNRRLWASWRISIGPLKVFFAGDTGYEPSMFQAIGAREGRFDLALLPIGSYLPRVHMAPVHVDPGQAVAIYQDIQARCAIGIHWGTFLFGAERPMQPVHDLESAVRAADLSHGAFAVMAIGQSTSLLMGHDGTRSLCWTESLPWP